MQLIKKSALFALVLSSALICGQQVQAAKGYVARYTEVDASTMTTEIYPGKGPGCEYVGHIVYLEKVYECTGKTISEAKTGTFTTPKARRIRELTRYDGKKWIY